MAFYGLILDAVLGHFGVIGSSMGYHGSLLIRPLATVACYGSFVRSFVRLFVRLLGRYEASCKRYVSVIKHHVKHHVKHWLKAFINGIG